VSGRLLTILLGGLILGLATQAAPIICNELPKISRDFTSNDFNVCEKQVANQTFDFYAFSICRDLNRVSVRGAEAKDINKCLKVITGKRFNYKKLRSCKSVGGASDKILNCLRSSAV
jgi:hypothetical protein